MEEWKEYKLGEIAEMKYGKLPNKFAGCKGQIPIWSGYRVVGHTNSVNCKKGTAIVVARGVGGTGDVKIAKEDCFLTNLSISISLNEKICKPLYFYYKYQTKNLKYLDSGSAQSQITIEDLKRLQLNLPPISYQNRVIEFLSPFYDKIEVNRKINSNLEEQAKALFKSWFIDFEPFKGGKFVDSELGMIPEGWNMMSFESFISESQDKAMVGTYPAYSVTNNGITPRIEKFKKQLSKATSKEKILRKDDLVFGMSRQILNWGIMQDEIGSVSSAYHVYKIDKGKTNPTYLRYFIKGYESYFRDLIGTAAREGQSLDKGALMNKKLLVPSKDILRSFIQHVTTIENTISLFKSQCRRLSTLRDTLLPRLMSGEIEVKS